MDQHKKPLYEALCNHVDKDPISYHVPGHKYGNIFPMVENNWFQSILKIDATELNGLDDLHQPEEVILEAEQLLADLYKVQQSYFLVNGSTSGNLSMVMAACNEGDLVLVQRNCHKSVLNALKLAKVNPIFLNPEFDDHWKIATGVSLQTVKQALENNPGVKAIILTYPNYYGIANDIDSIISLSHQQNIPVLVDEAHGPHFILGNPFPHSAVHHGADIVVQSAHKTLPAMTMGSFLHFNSNLININKVQDYLKIFQSSSPSYPIMASLDLARNYLALYQPEDSAFLLEQMMKFKENINQISGIRVLDYSQKGDPLKVTIQSTCQLNGYSLQKKFEEQGVFTELADPENVLFVLPLLKKDQYYPFEETINKMKNALAGIPLDIRNKDNLIYTNDSSRLSLTYREMQSLGITEQPFIEAEGKIAAEMVIPYPPGVPILLEGEKITKEKIEFLKKLIREGAKVQGGSGLKYGLIKIFKTT